MGLGRGVMKLPIITVLLNRIVVVVRVEWYVFRPPMAMQEVGSLIPVDLLILEKCAKCICLRNRPYSTQPND